VHLQAALEHMNPYGRIVMCGMIDIYNATAPVPGPPNLAAIIGKKLTMQGFIVSDHFDMLTQFYADLGKWIAEGQIKWKETIVEGLESAPRAFIGLFNGENFGKMIVKVGE
jgi:NADPH-dependent curcumin reductase CurA